jgi:histone H3/H4
MALVVKSEVKKVVEMNVGEDLVVALDRKVDGILKKAEERAKANGRRTVYARDL